MLTIRRLFITLVLFATLLSAAGCAKQGFPSGGPKDQTPPVVTGTEPANGTTHFDAKEFVIHFDEYVTVKDAENNILVSPPMKHKPEYKTKGRGIVVKIKDTLRENTTYLFQFKEAIADFTEGNVLPSYEYVFSTGDAMDTMSLGGRVLDARSAKPWKETVTVMAYREEQEGAGAQDAGRDTMATTEQPHYVTRCDKEGRFAFHYIPAGRYRLVALEDKNRNLRVDPADPAAWDTAFIVSRASSDSNGTARPVMLISAPENLQQRILKSEFAAPGRIIVVSQLPMQNPRIEDEKAQWQSRLNAKGDTLTAWCFDAKRDSARLVISDTGLQDTLKLRYIVKGKGGRRTMAGAKEEKPPLMTTLCDGNKAYYDDLGLAFINPIVDMTDSAMAEVMYLKDSTVTLFPITLDISGIMAHIMATGIKSGEQYRVRLAEGLFTDLYGNRSDSMTFTMTPKDYGTLTIDIDNRMGAPLVVEVLDKRDTVVQQQSLPGNGKLRFIHLPTGDYRLRAVVDKDSNGRWTPGDYRRQRLPEQAVFFEKTLSLRERWEMEERWVVEPPKETPRKALQAKELQGNIKPLLPGTRIDALKTQGAQ